MGGIWTDQRPLSSLLLPHLDFLMFKDRPGMPGIPGHDVEGLEMAQWSSTSECLGGLRGEGRRSPFLKGARVV